MGQGASRPDSAHCTASPEIAMKESSHLEKLFANNKKWVGEKIKDDPSYFTNMAGGQTPRYLWIGCSDSRVPAEFITGCEPGEMFIHRNIANLVVNSDINILSVLQFAVENIKVKDIIVCGHYGCGGVAAAASNVDHGLLDHWLRNIRDVNRLYNDELECIENPEERKNRLVELNVVEQCINLYKNGIIQRSQERNGYPRIHGLVYALETGLLKQIDINFKAYISNYKNIYRLYPFPKNTDAIVQSKAVENACEGDLDDEGRVHVDVIKRKITDCDEVLCPGSIEDALANVDLREDGKVPLKQLVTVLSEQTPGDS